jgi:hypothetical protein
VRTRFGPLDNAMSKWLWRVWCGGYVTCKLQYMRHMCVSVDCTQSAHHRARSHCIGRRCVPSCQQPACASWPVQLRRCLLIRTKTARLHYGCEHFVACGGVDGIRKGGVQIGYWRCCCRQRADWCCKAGQGGMHTLSACLVRRQWSRVSLHERVLERAKLAALPIGTHT